MFKDSVYFAMIGLMCTAFFAQGLKFTAKDWENVPKKSGVVLITSHTGYMNSTYVGLPFRKYRHYVRFMAKEEVLDHPATGPAMRACRHVPIDRIDSSKSFEEVCKELESDELVGIFLGSMISRSFKIKSLRPNAVHTTQCTGELIIPVLTMGSQWVWTKRHPKHLGRSDTPIHMVALPP